MSRPANAFRIGERVGDYEILDVLGTGGFGQVYKVRNVFSNRIEAMKVLLPSHIGDAAVRDRFLREIKVQAALRHPNIAELLGVRTHGDRILMCMEYVEGMTLASALERAAPSPALTCRVIGGVLDALGYAHRHGIVHRDIKPDNIMVRRDGSVKLMDFGIVLLKDAAKLTKTGYVVGTVHYMSPEQINAVPDLDRRSDLYSLGIVLYEALTGQKPFDGKSQFAVLAGHLGENARPPVEVNPSLPLGLSEVVMRAMAKDRGERFQTAEEFRQELEMAMGVRPAVAAPPPPPHTATRVELPAPASVAVAAPAVHYPPQAAPPPQAGVYVNVVQNASAAGMPAWMFAPPPPPPPFFQPGFNAPQPERRMSVFLSYSAQDAEPAQSIAASLQSWGANVLERGSAIQTCSVFLLLFSASSDFSSEVNREVETARRFGRRIVSVRMDRAEPLHLAPYLEGAQWVEYLQPAQLRALVALR